MTQEKKYFKQKAQGLIEYILLIAAVIVLMLIAFRANGPVPNSIQEVIEGQGDHMLNVARDVF